MKVLEFKLLPFGEDVSIRELNILSEELTKRLKIINPKITIANNVAVPRKSYNRRRQQYLAEHFLKIAHSQSGNRVLGITNVDLYTPELNFIFGQAEIKGKACVISLNRLREGALSLVFKSRMIKEAVHELGHTFGLIHCGDKFCVMHFSNCLADTDLKGEDYCGKCKTKLKKFKG